MGKSWNLACIFLASGHSKRFHENKLLADFNGKPIIETVLQNFPAELFRQTIVVTRYAKVALAASQLGYTIVENEDETDDIALTIRKGLEVLLPEIEGCLFSVCDQPLLKAASVSALRDAFCEDTGKIAALGYHGKRGNPVFFPAALFPELKSLASGSSGGAVIAAHPELLKIVEAEDSCELFDIDRSSDLDALKQRIP